MFNNPVTEKLWHNWLKGGAVSPSGGQAGSNNADMSTGLSRAVNEVARSFGDIPNPVTKGKSVHIVGSRDNLASGVEAMLWEGTNTFETYVSTNIIGQVSSDNVGNTQDIIVEGHTIDGSGNFTFVIQTVTLNGQTGVALGTPLARISQLYNNDSVDFVSGSRIYVSEIGSTIVAGVPLTATEIHLEFPADGNQSLKCSTTFSNNDYAFLTSISYSVRRANAGEIDLFLKIRRKGKTFRTRYISGGI